jgi:hypothetical protein
MSLWVGTVSTIHYRVFKSTRQQGFINCYKNSGDTGWGQDAEQWDWRVCPDRENLSLAHYKFRALSPTVVGRRAPMFACFASLQHCSRISPGPPSKQGQIAREHAIQACTSSGGDCKSYISSTTWSTASIHNAPELPCSFREKVWCIIGPCRLDYTPR